MKKVIRKVLERYVGRYANMDSITLREMITDEIVDEIELEYIVQKKPSDSSSWDGSAGAMFREI